MRFFHRNGPACSSQGGNETGGASFDSQAQSLIPAEVRLISGCHSEQTSADVADASRVAQLPNPAGRSGGACTLALLDILYASSAPGGGSPSSRTTTTSTNQNSSNLTFQELLLRLRESLAAKGLSQIPQLTSSRPLELKRTPFSLSSGPGQRRALLVGINYRGQSGELRGCHNDIVNVRRYLIDRQGYSPNNILVLLDDGKHIFPTRQKIILGLQQLVEHSRSGDNVYFHYSGHGGLLSPEGFNSFKLNHKEYDETLFPVDVSAYIVFNAWFCGHVVAY
jgi:metacaspase-1